MSKQTDTSTVLTSSHHEKLERYLLQAQGLNLALWTSSDIDEQMKLACWLMDDLLKNIGTEFDNMWRELNVKNCHPAHR